MAKWGEGDPRWIVEERPDATNVNNWHWTEKNADAWSRTRLENLFKNIEIVTPATWSADHSSSVGQISVKIDSIEKCEGEARVNNRKGKLIFFYEWAMTLKFMADVRHNEADGDEATVEGKVEIPNFSEEHTDLQDVDISVTSDVRSDDFSAVRNFLQKQDGAKQIRDILQSYIDALKREFSQGIILETKTNKTDCKDQTKLAKGQLVNLSIANGSNGNGVRSKSDAVSARLPSTSFTTLTFDERFKCTGQEVYNVLTQRELVEAFSQSSCEAPEGGLAVGVKFTLLNGNIWCEFTEMKPFVRVAMKWRLQHWLPADHYSTVEIDVDQQAEDTVLHIKQTGVPDKEAEMTKQGWKKYYWNAIRNVFGYGSNMF